MHAKTPTIFSFILSALLLAGCDKADDDTSVVQEAVTLSTGLRVDAFASANAFDSLPESPTPSEFCEAFYLNMTVFVHDGEPTGYVATAASKNIEPIAEAGSNDHEVAAQVAHYLRDVLPNMQTVGGFNYAHFTTNPIGVAGTMMTSDPDAFPAAQVVFDRNLGLPMLGILQTDGEPGQVVFPSIVQTDALIPDTEQSLTARFIEGEQTLRQCAGAMEAIRAALDTAAVSNLAECGDLMVVPFGLADGVEPRGGWFCNWGAGYGVTFSPLYKNPWGDMSCPRVQTEYEYACFSREDTR